VWTWDFIADATVRGGALRILTILDEYTRECHVLRADRALRARDVLEWLQKAIQEHGAPAYGRRGLGTIAVRRLFVLSCSTAALIDLRDGVSLS
jgi:putative transposase